MIMSLILVLSLCFNPGTKQDEQIADIENQVEDTTIVEVVEEMDENEEILLPNYVSGSQERDRRVKVILLE